MATKNVWKAKNTWGTTPTGTRGDQLPVNGRDGKSIWFQGPTVLVNLPADNEVLFRVTGYNSTPATGTFEWTETGTLVWTAPKGSTGTAVVAYERDGIAQDPVTINLQIAGLTLVPESGVFAYSGASLDLDYGSTFDYTLAVESGVYTYSGGDITFTRGYNLPPDTGVFTYSGGTVNFALTPSLLPEAGLFTYTGNDLTLTYAQLVSIPITTYSIDFVSDDIQ